MISKFDYPENLVNDLNSKYKLRLSMPINDKENQLINDAISLLDITSNMVIRLKYYNQFLTMLWLYFLFQDSSFISSTTTSV